jgi:hypothetical protein
MKRSSYAERDYAFGQLMLRLRRRIGLTQAGLAKHLGVARQAVGELEALSQTLFRRVRSVGQSANPYWSSGTVNSASRKRDYGPAAG